MRTYTARQLITCYRWCRQHPQGHVPIDRFETLTADEWVAWFRRCLDLKVSATLRGFHHGRKWDKEWQTQAWRTSREVNTPRLAVHWVPYEFRHRLRHRLSPIGE